MGCIQSFWEDSDMKGTPADDILPFSFIQWDRVARNMKDDIVICNMAAPVTLLNAHHGINKRVVTLDVHFTIPGTNRAVYCLFELRACWYLTQNQLKMARLSNIIEHQCQFKWSTRIDYMYFANLSKILVIGGDLLSEQHRSLSALLISKECVDVCVAEMGTETPNTYIDTNAIHRGNSNINDDTVVIDNDDGNDGDVDGADGDEILDDYFVSVKIDNTTSAAADANDIVVFGPSSDDHEVKKVQ